MAIKKKAKPPAVEYLSEEVSRKLQKAVIRELHLRQEAAVAGQLSIINRVPDRVITSMTDVCLNCKQRVIIGDGDHVFIFAQIREIAEAVRALAELKRVTHIEPAKVDRDIIYGGHVHGG